jgi:hypothetical protein
VNVDANVNIKMSPNCLLRIWLGGCRHAVQSSPVRSNPPAFPRLMLDERVLNGVEDTVLDLLGPPSVHVILPLIILPITSSAEPALNRPSPSHSRHDCAFTFPTMG